MSRVPADPAPRLIRVGPLVGSPDGLVLVLHGGAARGDRTEVSPTQLSVLRMIPIARRIRRAGRRRLAVYRLLNSRRGWAEDGTPVQDARWAIEQMTQRFGSTPIGLVGHSLGGRAALHLAGAPGVRGVVAMAPWVYPDEQPPAAHTRIMVLHGDRDRVASPTNSLAVARRMSTTAGVTHVTVRDGAHSMIRRGRVFDGLAAEFIVAVQQQVSPSWRGGPLPEAPSWTVAAV